ncbi:hypothetical protein GH865_10975 [Rhodocyclus tenuis]|uniref:hypothetical protein n=1 Tax=Rhodocyclus gracilis TaxID=2929842 RepID=UPI001298BFB1|nr:hypothetical protein [Rhodocyclus gracilis]MRD73767.1 hypothetical protein [Rhodocyclus gracilis]
MAGILVREGEVAFAKPIARAVLRDSRLSFGARGLFCYLWDLPAGWQPCASHLALMGPDGRDAILSRLAELEEVGAMRIERIRNSNGKFAGKRWVLIAADRWAIESPLSARKAEKRIPRSSARPNIGKPATKVNPSEGSANSAEEAATSAPATREGPAAAANSSGKKKRRCTPSGIVTWHEDDEDEARRLELENPAELLTAAVKEAIAAGRQPVPGIVATFLDAQKKSKQQALQHSQILAQVADRIASELASADGKIEAGRQFIDAVIAKKRERHERR